jgi:N-acetylneuraminic acid mutarotase
MYSTLRPILLLLPLALLLLALQFACDDCEICEITEPVTDRPISLLVEPEAAQLEVGDTVRFKARFAHESGDTTAAERVVWLSFKPAVATIDTTGLAEGVSSGRAKIIAAADGLMAEGIITVPGWFVATPLPEPRRNGHAAALDGKLYYIGGASSAGEDYVSTTFVFDPESESWSTGPDMPTARDQGAVAVLEGRIYVIGGVNPQAPNNGYSRLWANEAFRVADRWWEVRAPMPTARGHAQADTLSGQIYVIAGSTVVEVYDTVEVYHSASDTWSVAPSISTTRWNFAAASIGGALYAVGGEVSRLVPTGTLEIFNVSEGSWSPGPPMPTPRLKMAWAVFENRLVVIGGYDGTAVLDVVEVFDPAAGTWSTLPALPVARQMARATVVGGILYVLGGLTESGITNRVDGYIP